MWNLIVSVPDHCLSFHFLYNQNKHKGKTYFYDLCLYGFSREDLLINHRDEYCGINDKATKIKIPQPGKNIINFKNYHKQISGPFVIYADFESIIKPYNARAGDKSETQTIHEACGFCCQIVRYDGVSTKPFIYRGEMMLRCFRSFLNKKLIT